MTAMTSINPDSLVLGRDELTDMTTVSTCKGGQSEWALIALTHVACVSISIIPIIAGCKHFNTSITLTSTNLGMPLLMQFAMHKRAIESMLIGIAVSLLKLLKGCLCSFFPPTAPQMGKICAFSSLQAGMRNNIWNIWWGEGSNVSAVVALSCEVS